MLFFKDNHPKYQQAVQEVYGSLEPLFHENPKYRDYFKIIMEPERVIQFKVLWEDDQGKLQMNKGFRVQFNSSLGPYKGGLRFHPTVDEDTLKFLGFEQVFKNALTSEWLGGGKGGSDFNKEGRSEAEIRRFCSAFMTELSKHIGENVDVPAGDIGVGGREIGYLYGSYKNNKNSFDSVLTGKGVEWGGSFIRPEATGYGLVYFVEHMLNDAGFDIKTLSVAVSGSGNVAQFAVEKLLELGVKVVTMSDSRGTVYFKDGITRVQLEAIKELKNINREKLSSIYGNSESWNNMTYFDSCKPWTINDQLEEKVKLDIALPCATENELDDKDAQSLKANGCFLVAEGANMPCIPEAIDYFHQNDIMYASGKMSNGGGVGCSSLEMAQNASKSRWTREEVDNKLKTMMKHIYDSSINQSKRFGCTLMDGGNIAGFLRVVESMENQGKLF